MGRFFSQSPISDRFGAKSRATREDLESRRDWLTNGPRQFLSDVHVLGQIDMRGCQIEMRAKCSWDPRFRIIRWGGGGGGIAGAIWMWPPTLPLHTVTGFVGIPRRLRGNEPWLISTANWEMPAPVFTP